MSRNDDGRRTVTMDVGTLAFALENCEINIRMTLTALDPVSGLKFSRETGEKLVKLIEDFKKLKAALEDAR